MKRVFTAMLVVLVLLPAIAETAQATPYYWETGCFSVPLLQRCWATNFDPNSGSLGSQSRTDNLQSLPTWNGIHSYGDPSLPRYTCGGDPLYGGDVVGAGSNAGCSPGFPPDCTGRPSCHADPAEFVTQNYVDGNGAWHFAMGGADQCVSDGSQVPCNVQHKMYPYDCRDASAQPGCTSLGYQAMPFTWGFPGDPTFEMTSNLHVGGATGTWHAFVCANFSNKATPGVDNYVIEVCDEPFDSVGHPIRSGISTCTTNHATLWQRPGETSPYMRTYYSTTHSTGVTIPVRWTMTRSQFIALVNAVAPCAPGRTLDMTMDNWKLAYSQNGAEISGPAPYGSGITFQIQDETMTTHY